MFIKLNKDESEYTHQIINVFIEGVSTKNQSSSYYIEKRKASPHKVIKDIYLGKMAEFLVCKALSKIGYPKIEPDCIVTENKNWSADLQYSKFGFPNVHVKACCKWTFDYCKDYSWTFQTKDDLFISKSNDLVALVYLEHYNSSEGEIKAILPWTDIKSKLKDPLKREFIGSKKCLYYKDLYENS